MFVYSAAGFNGITSIQADVDQLDFLYLYGSNQAYDATDITLNGVDYLYLFGSNLTVTVDQGTFTSAALDNVSGSAGNAMTTSEAVLDLSGIRVSGLSVESTNAAGTIFEVDRADSAVQIFGGAGVDTVRTDDFAFDATERAFIFGTTSIEVIEDTSGTYTSPAAAPGTFTLTTGADAPVMSSADETVFGTADTLTTDDTLDAGDGTDGLVLYGAGTFDLNALSSFSGFESVEILNLTTTLVDLTLKEGSSTDVTIVADGRSYVTASGSTEIGSLLMGDGNNNQVTLSGDVTTGNIDTGAGSGATVTLQDNVVVDGDIDLGDRARHEVILRGDASVTGTVTLGNRSTSSSSDTDVFLYDNTSIGSLDFVTGQQNELNLYGTSSITNIDMGTSGGNRLYLRDTSTTESVILSGSGFERLEPNVCLQRGRV